MRFDKGLWTDGQPVDNPQGTWLDGTRNWVVDEERGILVNEQGFIEWGDPLTTGYPSGTLVPIGIIPLRNEANIILSVDIAKLNTKSEIGILDKNGIYDMRISDPLLDFKAGYPMTGEAKYNFDEEIIAAFSNNFDTPFLINLDNLPVLVDGSGLIGNPPEFVELLKMFPKFNIPIVTNAVVNDGGGSLASGVYYGFFAYELPDGSLTNWVAGTNPLSVTEDTVAEGFDKYDGVEANASTSKSITFSLEALDERYGKIHLAIVKKIDGVVTAEIVGKTNIDKVTIDIPYTGGESTTTVDIKDIIVHKPVYERMKAFTQLDRQLYVGNVEREAKIDYQKYANNIKVEWIYEEQVNILEIKGGYKDSQFIYSEKPFMPNEVYALYIKLNFLNGSPTEIFHIPGRAPVLSLPAASDYTGASELDLVSDISGSFTELVEDEKIDENVRLFHTRGTATKVTSEAFGNMGYWENENEKYLSIESSEIWDVDSNGDGSNVGDLSGVNVRHHKFPSLKQLTDFGFKWMSSTQVEVGGDDLGGWSMFSVGIAQKTGFSANWKVLKFGSSTDTATEGFIQARLGEPNAINTEYIATAPQDITVLVNNLVLSANITGGERDTGSQSIDMSLRIVKINASGSPIRTYSIDRSFTQEEPFSASVRIDGTYIIHLEDGEGIRIVGEIQGNTFQGGVLNTSADSGVITSTEILSAPSSSGTGDIYGRKLGLKLSQIKFPEEIRDKIQSYEIYYARRDPINQTVLGMSLIFPYFWNANNNWFGDGESKFHSFDMLANKISEVPSFISNELILESLNTTTETEATPSGVSPQSEFKLYDMFVGAISGSYTAVGITNQIRQVINPRYVANHILDVPGTSLDNEFGEEHFQPLIPSGMASPGGFDFKYLSTMNAFKRNVFKAYTNQVLVSTGRVIPINQGTFDYSIPMLYGGDTFISPYGIKLTLRTSSDSEASSTATYFFPTQSVTNINLRHEPISGEWWQKYYRATDSYADHTFARTIPTGTLDDEGNDVGQGQSTPSDELWLRQRYMQTFSNDFSYNKDYSSVNDIHGIVAFDPTARFTTKQHYTIIRTPASEANETDESWRIFLSDDQKTMARNRGVIWNLEHKRDILYIHMEESLFRTIGSTKIPTDQVEATLGAGNIFDQKPQEILTTRDGYAGLHSQFGAILTKFGYFFPDEGHGKIFIFADGLNEVSDTGLRNYFRDNLPLELSAQISRLEGSQVVIDNPYVEAGVIAAYDEKFNRIIVTKRDYVIDTDKEGFWKGVFDPDGTYSVTGGGGTYQPESMVIRDGLLQYIPDTVTTPTIDDWVPIEGSDITTDTSWTRSYSPSLGLDQRGGWINFHDWIPYALFATKNGLFSFNGELYKHNDPNSRCKYYGGTVFPTIFEPVFNYSPDVSKLYFNTNWRTEIFDLTGVTIDRSLTFNIIQFLNSYQGSDPIALSVFAGIDVLTYNIRNVKNTWNFNKMRDNDPDWYNRKRFIDKYLIVKLTYNNLESPQKLLYLYEISMKMRLANR